MGYHTDVNEPSLFYYLPIAGGEIVGFMPFLRILVPCEMQTLFKDLNVDSQVHLWWYPLQHEHLPFNNLKL